MERLLAAGISRARAEAHLAAGRVRVAGARPRLPGEIVRVEAVPSGVQLTVTGRAPRCTTGAAVMTTDRAGADQSS